MRTILHSDLNNFYASVECLKHPEYRGLPLAVVGDKDDRHGIVLAKNQLAKAYGVKTGDVYWLAERKCGKLIEIKADFPSYLQVSKEVRKIYEDYTDKIEAFGIDECWLDVSGSERIFGDGEKIAMTLRERIKSELGLTVSIGVSWNKIFAKLGSDMKKPDAVTVITPDNYQDKVWVLPVRDLLYVGDATERKLRDLGIRTIGELANFDVSVLIEKLGKWGLYLHSFANGQDSSPVLGIDEEDNVKSIGNSLTNYKDIENSEEARVLIYLLADSISARIREAGLNKATTVHAVARANDLESYAKQGKLPYPSGNADDIAQTAYKLFCQMYDWKIPLRGLGISVSGFVLHYDQLNIFADLQQQERQAKLEKAVDKLRKKYDNNIIQRAIVYKDQKLKNLDIKKDHVIHPYSFFRNGGN